MMHSLKFGAAAMVAVFGGGSFYLGAAETPAFAQATNNGATGQTATTGTTGGATAMPQRRVNRPRPGGIGGTDVRGGQGGAGSPTIADPVPLTASECRALGGDIVVTSPNESCQYRDGSRGGVCITERREIINGVLGIQIFNLCINER